MSKTITQTDWQQQSLLAANQQLVKHYQNQPSACLALLISRNYRLLLTQSERPDIKQIWQQMSQRWWEMYCRQRQLPALSPHEFFHY
jgi:hypothetical protein